MAPAIPEKSKKEKSQINTIEDTVKALREEAATDKALNAICHIFAGRERARSQITMGSLRQTMLKEGFRFSVEEYEKVLRFMAGIGIGKLHFDRSGKIDALKDIKITLQSLGLAAVSKKDNFEPFLNQHKKFVDVPLHPRQMVNLNTRASEPIGESHVTARVTSHVEPQGDNHSYSACLEVTIEGKAVKFPLPQRITPQEIGEILTRGIAAKQQ